VLKPDHALNTAIGHDGLKKGKEKESFINKLYMIKFQSYNTNNISITYSVLEAYTSKFWEDIFMKHRDNKHLMLMCKVEFDDTELGYRTLGHLRRVNFEDKELFLEYLSERLGLLTDSYTTYPISIITFTYIVKDGLASGNRALLQDLTDKSITTYRFNNINLPITMDPAKYGTVLTKEFIGSFTRYIVTNNIKVFQIDVYSSPGNSTINKVSILGQVNLNWIDYRLSEGFKREIGKSTLYFVDGEIILRKQQLSAKPFTKLSVDRGLNNNFITMDIETIKIDNKITPYLICAYNGKDYISSYGKDQKDLFTSFIHSLLTFFRRKSNTLTVYAHNLSGFDGIFLMRRLLPFGQVEPLLFNGRLMSIRIKLNILGYQGKTIIFKDSYLLLPLSLRKLCVAFDVPSVKGYFPFLLTNIYYTGILPKF